MSVRRPLALGLLFAALGGCEREPLGSGRDAGGGDGAAATVDLASRRDLAFQIDLWPHPPDLAAPPSDRSGPPLPFLVELEGIWLVGWSGGLEHYSWVRITVAGQTQGRADFLDGKDIPINAPIWDCNGEGAWTITAKPDTIQLQLPAACGLPDEVYTIGAYRMPPGWPPSSILYADWERLPGMSVAGGNKYPPSQCDPAFTRCTSPF